METSNNTQHWTVCSVCNGQGKVVRELTKKQLRIQQLQLEAFRESESSGVPPVPKKNIDRCSQCSGSGLQPSETVTPVDTERYPTVAIIGGGIGGAAFASACLHRGIPFTLYERDDNFDARSQGYGLTLQQASKAIAALGITSLPGGVTSTRHVVHDTDGIMIGEWGLRKWNKPIAETSARRKNVHVPRQTLRQSLFENLHDETSVVWGHELQNVQRNKRGHFNIHFKVGKESRVVTADLIVGADGIRSKVREIVIGEEAAPLQYMGCIVILGICPLASLINLKSPLLDSATVFQTVNGHERMYTMPYSEHEVMWQYSFPLSETKAKELSSKGSQALKAEVLSRVGEWHDPVPQMVAATEVADVTGYPVYDREVFTPAKLESAGCVTLLGDAAHPMSPFKGQGANQALLDALSLARSITAACSSGQAWRDNDLLERTLREYEEAMAARTASKVTASATAARLLHSDAVLQEGDGPRGREV